MNPHINQLLEQLKQMSPMPDDDIVTQEQLDAYAAIFDKIRGETQRDPDIRVVPALLASLGYPDYYELYQSILLIMVKFSDQQLLPHLIEAVQHAPKGGRQWAALYMGYTKDPIVIPYLLTLLSDPEEHVRAHAITALGSISDPSTRSAVASLLEDPSLEVRDAVECALEDWPG